MAATGPAPPLGSTGASAPVKTALIIDGSYALIGARKLGGKIDYIKLRSVLEEQASTTFGDCWFFDQNPMEQVNKVLTKEYNMLKCAAPIGPQFQVSLFSMKKYSCHCRKCGHHFTQNVQKGVDNGIATKILSLAYENICDRFVLFAGDGDFYSSLNQARNVLRKDIWVIGYHNTVSGDLQQLASRVIWMDDLWSQVKSVPVDTNLRDQGRRDGAYNSRPTSSRDSPVLPAGDNEEIGDRQVVIAPVESDTANSSSRGAFRGRVGRVNGKGRGGRGRNGRRSRSRSQSRSKDRPRQLRAQQARTGEIAAPGTVPTNIKAATNAAVAAAGTRSQNDGKRGPGGKNGKKRRRNDNNERGQAKRGGRGNGQTTSDTRVFTLSDVSSEEEVDHPFPVALPTAPAPMPTFGPETPMSLLGSRDQAINLASDTESE